MNCTSKKPSFKLNKSNGKSISLMKNYTKKKLVKLLVKNDSKTARSLPVLKRFARTLN